MVPPLWKTVWHFLKQLNIHKLTIEPPNSTLISSHEKLKTYVHTKTFTSVFTEALFIRVKKWKQISISWSMDKTTFCNIHAIPLISKKEGTTDTYENIVESQKHHAK